MPTNTNQTETKISKQPTNFNWPEIEKTTADLKTTFGFIPNFANTMVKTTIPGAWNEAKNLRFSNDTALDIKLKSLIALTTASQIPCEMINHFEKNATLAEGVTTQEQFEAITMGAIVRHWSIVINGSQMDKIEFRKEVDLVMYNAKIMMGEMRGSLPDEKMFLVLPLSAEETYKDIGKSLGFVPTFFRLFPKEGIAGAWSEFKALQLNPYTALNGKEKELIGLAVAAQIPCDYCIYFHRAAASLNGATEVEIQEAVALAAITRHWSVLFNSPITEPNTFKKEAEQMIINSMTQKVH